MAEGNANLIRGVYGFNWAAAEEQRRGLAAAGEVMAQDVQARGRRSNMPLRAPFGHLWTLSDGRVVRVEASVQS